MEKEKEVTCKCPYCKSDIPKEWLENNFCKNCDEDFDESLDDDIEFIRCDSCDGHDACADFGCAIEQGIIKKPDGIF